MILIHRKVLPKRPQEAEHIFFFSFSMQQTHAPGHPKHARYLFLLYRVVRSAVYNGRATATQFWQLKDIPKTNKAVTNARRLDQYYDVKTMCEHKKKGKKNKKNGVRTMLTNNFMSMLIARMTGERTKEKK